MINITGPFPNWAYRISPTVLLCCGVVIGSNAPTSPELLQSRAALSLAVLFAVIAIGFCNGSRKEPDV